MRTHVSIIALSMILSAACGSATNPPANSTPVANSNGASTVGGGQAPVASPVATASPTSSPEGVDAKTVAVRFPAGATEASYTDSFSGYGVVDYKFDARGDQQLTAEITQSDADKAVLTVLRNGTAVENDASMVQGWTGLLPANGSYVIRVGQMRSAARRGEAPVKFSLRIEIVD